MDEIFKISASCIDLHIKSNKQKEVLKHLVDLLVQQDFVEEDYADEIIRREANYPTGLQFENIAIALPHGNAAHVKHSTLAIGKCEQEIYFQNMSNPEEEIKVDIIVLLAIKDPDTHLKVMKNLMTMFTLPEKCRQILAADNKTLCEIFKNTLNKE